MLMFGLQVAIIAMSIVFIALMALMFVIQGSSAFFQKKTDEPKVVAVPESTPAPAPVEAAPVQKDDNELAAVIAAAIAACGHQVVVKSISRVVGTSGAVWAATGRTDAMSLRQL
jgi:sodium pump decarboxylase gamma subunit